MPQWLHYTTSSDLAFCFYVKAIQSSHYLELILPVFFHLYEAMYDEGASSVGIANFAVQVEICFLHPLAV